MKIKSFKGYGLAITFSLFTLLLNCSRQGEIPEDLVAQVNDKYLEKQHVLYHIPERLDSDLQFALKKNVIDRWVENEILYQSALNEGLALNSKEQYQIEELRKSFLIERYLDQKLNRDYRISQKDIEDYYREHKGEFIRNLDEAHIIHVMIEQKDQAIFRDIRESSNLNEIIKKYYLDERSSQNNPNDDLGYVAVERLPDPISRRIRQMKTGTISREIKTDPGYHFVQLIDFQKSGTVRGLDLVRDEIIMRLKKERREEELLRLKSELKQNFQVQTYLSKIQ